MHRFSAPDKPDNFDDAVKAHADSIKDAVLKKDVLSFNDSWKEFRASFSEAQWGKCGYCELRVIGADFGDVEHFRPKGAVHELSNIESEWGEEKPWESNVKGRKTKLVNEKGYWWYAYHWDNYLLSCKICNGQWKGNLFPVREIPRPQCEEGVHETPLLLNPYSGPSPFDHLEFGALGDVAPANGSDMGWETIKTLGLNRPSLYLARRSIAERTYERILALNPNMGKSEKLRIFEDIQKDGSPSEPHCGMVRNIFSRYAGVSWEELNEIIMALKR